jgi:sulfite exporter TauE/SafE
MAISSERDTSPNHPTDSNPPGKLGAALRRFLALLLILSGLGLLLYLDSVLGHHAELPAAGETLSYALIFTAGLFTGFHCVGMCGALVVGYTVNAAQRPGSKYFTHLYYGTGKTLSYTAIGALFGALGAIVTFTPFIRGLAGIAAGVFLLLFGLATLNLFPSLSRFRIKTPGFVMRRLGQALRKYNHPFAIGLLNGLMIICGPLQAMYIMAAGTGSPVEGAKLLFVYGLGTLPVMMGFGVLTSALSRQMAPRIVKASGVVVIALGAIMLNRGLAMTGTGYDFNSLRVRFAAEEPAGAEPPANAGVQVVHTSVDPGGFEPNRIVLHKGVPVKWIIQGSELNSCNHRIVVPSLGLEVELHQGENIVEFTPEQDGPIAWSCAMGDLSGTFQVQGKAPPATDPAAPHAAHDHGGSDVAPPGRMQQVRERAAAWIEGVWHSLSEFWKKPQPDPPAGS